MADLLLVMTSESLTKSNIYPRIETHMQPVSMFALSLITTRRDGFSHIKLELIGGFANTGQALCSPVSSSIILIRTVDRTDLTFSLILWQDACTLTLS